MAVNRARLCQRTAIWIAAVWSGPMSVSAAAQEKADFTVATPESQGVSSAAVRRVAGEVEEYVKNGTIVGGELLIIKNRKTILHEVYGARDREDKRAMERDTIFNIRSMTKPLTGVAVQMLADEGKLRLGDPVAKYLPGFDNDKSKAITIEQLLQHRSGLPLSIVTVRIDQFSDLQTQAKAIGEKGPQFKPGEKFWYSDAGSDAAAAVVERIAGTTIDRFVAERILQPLGMADSFYLSKADDPRKKRVASLYFGSPGKWTRYWKPGGAPFYPFAWGSQTLYSTPADYARFLALWMDGGMAGGKRLLSSEAIARILTPSVADESTRKRWAVPMRVLRAETALRPDVHAVRTRRKSDHGGSEGYRPRRFGRYRRLGLSRGEPDRLLLHAIAGPGQHDPVGDDDPGCAASAQGAGKVPAEMKSLIGTYYANFGTFKNTPFQVVFRCGKLALDIPSQLVFELKEPDKEGRGSLYSPTRSQSHSRKTAGARCRRWSLHQSGMSFQLPRDKPVNEERPKK